MQRSFRLKSHEVHDVLRNIVIVKAYVVNNLQHSMEILYGLKGKA